MRYLQALLVLLLALVLAGFIQQNAETTVLNYFGWHSVGLPLSLFMIIAFGIGYLSAVIIGFSGDIRFRFKLFQAHKEAKRLKGELAKQFEESSVSEPDSTAGSEIKQDTQDTRPLAAPSVKDAAEVDDPVEEGTETI